MPGRSRAADTRGRPWVWFLVLTLLLTGCFGGDGGDPDDTPEGTTTPGPTGSTTTTSTTTGPSPGPSPDPSQGNETGSNATDPRGPVTWGVSIAGTAFVDGTFTIQQGDTVRWVHEDGTTPHTVTADDGAFDSGPVYMVEAPTVGEFESTFDDVGDFAYHCEVHPSMTGTITVLERFDGTPDV